MLVDQVVGVGLQLGPGCEEVPPRVGGLERVRVHPAGDVDPHTGVDVLVPGPAHIVVLVDDLERNPDAFEVDRDADPGHSRADDENLEAGALGLGDRGEVDLPRHRVNGEFLHPEVVLLLGDRRAHRELHQAVQ
jgi:hypothetical protein